jgi:hypothetical protein
VVAVAHVKVLTPSKADAVYDVMAEPPFDTGGFQETLSEPAPGATVLSSGAPGAVDGVADCDELGDELPTALVALTLTVYVTPLTRPVIWHVRDVVVQEYVVVPSLADAV